MKSPSQTIRRDTRVFISSVTRELGSMRKLVKKGLEDNDYHPVEQDSFPPDYRDLKDKLRARIASCDAVVHIAGHCYGAEPEHRPADAPRRSYTQLEYDIAVDLGKPVYVFLTGVEFPTDPHDPEPAELRQLQEAHRQRLTSTGQDYNPIDEREQLDQKVRSLQLKVERLEDELHHVDRQVVVTGGRLRRWLVAVAILGIAALGTVGYVGWRQQVEHIAQEKERAEQDRERAEQDRERAKQERERIAAEAARKEAETVKQIQQEFAERFLQQLLTNKEIKAEEARQRALKELPALVKLPMAEIQSLIDRKLRPQASEASQSPLDRARAALATGNYDDVFKAADDQKQQGRELAMLEGTAALARFRQSPSPEWNARALAAFQRAMALADVNSATQWQAWTDAAVSAASVLYDLARYAEAEPLLRDCLRLSEVNSGPDSRGAAVALNRLAVLLRTTNRPREAEPLYRRTLAIHERSYGPDHPDVAIGLDNLGDLLRATNRAGEAEPLFRRALAIDEDTYGPDHFAVARDLYNLSLWVRATNRVGGAEPLSRRALAICERSRGPDHPDVAIFLESLAELLQLTNRPGETEPLNRRALAILEHTYGPDHRAVAGSLDNLAALLFVTNRSGEAEPLFRRALAIYERSIGPGHSDVAGSLSNLAELLRTTNRPGEAEPLYRRALAIFERSYGPDHPAVAIRLNNLAAMLKDANRLGEAEPLFRRALAIDERSYGPDHPNVAIRLDNLVSLLQDTNRVSEAEPLMARGAYLLAIPAIVGPQTPVPAIHGRKLPPTALLAEAHRGGDHSPDQNGDRGYGQAVAHRAGGRATAGPVQTGRGRAGSVGSPVQRAGQACGLLKPNEPIVPHLDELLRPNGDGLTARGIAAFRAGAHADAVVSYEAALELLDDQPALLPARLRTRVNRTAALRELGLVAQARDELSRLLPELEKLPAAESLMKGRARYHLAFCQWRLGDRAAAQRSAEESLAAYDGAPKANPIDPDLRRQSEALLADARNGKAPPPLAAVDAPAALEAARARYRAREELTRLALTEKAAPLLDRMLSPARPTKDVLETLDRQYREKGKPPVWFLPLKEPIAPHLDQLLGPGKTVNDVLESLDKQYRQQGKPAVWFLPLSEPIAPHLDELLGKPSR